jgi:hypothetical protein
LAVSDKVACRLRRLTAAQPGRQVTIPVPVPDEAAARHATKRLVAIKTIHTFVWAFFAGCIVTIPILAWLGRLRYAAALIAVTFVEVLVIALNNGSCPLTGVAARYTPDRRDNLDIYLPEWLARHNKRIFGALYAGGVILTGYLWQLRRAV